MYFFFNISVRTIKSHVHGKGDIMRINKITCVTLYYYISYVTRGGVVKFPHRVRVHAIHLLIRNKKIAVFILLLSIAKNVLLWLKNFINLLHLFILDWFGFILLLAPSDWSFYQSEDAHGKVKHFGLIKIIGIKLFVIL